MLRLNQNKTLTAQLWPLASNRPTKRFVVRHPLGTVRGSSAARCATAKPIKQCFETRKRPALWTGGERRRWPDADRGSKKIVYPGWAREALGQADAPDMGPLRGPEAEEPTGFDLPLLRLFPAARSAVNRDTVWSSAPVTQHTRKLASKPINRRPLLPDAKRYPRWPSGAGSGLGVSSLIFGANSTKWPRRRLGAARR